MDVKDAVKTAKTYVADLFSDEGVRNLLLEEVEFVPQQQVWRVTVGFLRQWPEGTSPVLMAVAGSPKRSYKVVTISDKDSKIVSLREREGMV